MRDQSRHCGVSATRTEAPQSATAPQKAKRRQSAADRFARKRTHWKSRFVAIFWTVHSCCGSATSKLTHHPVSAPKHKGFGSPLIQATGEVVKGIVRAIVHANDAAGRSVRLI